MSYLGLIISGLVILLLDVTLTGLLSIGSSQIQPSLSLPFIVYSGLNYGPIVGNVAGAALGLALDLTGSAPLGATMFAYSAVGFISGKSWDQGPFRIFWPWGGFVMLAALLTESLSNYLYARGSGIAFHEIFLKNGLPAAIYTTCIGLLWYLSPLHRIRKP